MPQKTKTTNKDNIIRVRIKSSLKEETAKIFEKLGMNYSDAINLFLSQVRLRKGLPFDVKIPNKETLAAMKEVEAGENLTSYDSVETMFEDAKNW